MSSLQKTYENNRFLYEARVYPPNIFFILLILHFIIISISLPLPSFHPPILPHLQINY